MTEQSRRQTQCLETLATTAEFARTTLNRLTLVQSRLRGIGEDEAADEVDDMIDHANEVYVALERIRRDVKTEMTATTKGTT